MRHVSHAILRHSGRFLLHGYSPLYFLAALTLLRCSLRCKSQKYFYISRAGFFSNQIDMSPAYPTAHRSARALQYQRCPELSLLLIQHCPGDGLLGVQFEALSRFAVGTYGHGQVYEDDVGRVVMNNLSSLTGFWFDCVTSIPWSWLDFATYKVRVLQKNALLGAR